MSLKSEEKSPIYSEEELVFVLAIAGRIDAQGRLLAKQLDKDRTIHDWYNIADSLSSSCSMLKYVISMFFPAYNNAKALHDFLLSPEGIAIVTGEALFLVAFSFLAGRLERDPTAKDDPVKKAIIIAWPYFRDVMKGMKNSYKALNTAFSIASTITGADLKSVLIPAGLLLGLFAAANRILIRYLGDKRKAKQTANDNFLAEILAMRSFSEADLDKLYERHEVQFVDDIEWIVALGAMGFGGFLDGVYLYAGLVTLAVLSPPAFLAMAIISGFYTIVCVISRLYEEYDNQIKLLASQTKCELALVAKELEATYARLLIWERKININGAEHDATSKHLREDVVILIERFEALRKILKRQTNDTYLTAALYGLRQGLFTYGVLAGLLFMLTAVFYISAIVFPPALLIACISSGLVFIIGVMACTMYNHYCHLQDQPREENEPFHDLVVMKDKIKENIDAKFLSGIRFEQAMKDGKNFKDSPSYSFPKWFEVIRSFLAGISKGNNFANVAGTPLQDVDPQSHDHDSPAMLMLTICCTTAFSIILALRALARELKTKEPVVEAQVKPTPEVISKAEPAPAPNQPEPVSATVPQSTPISTIPTPTPAFGSPADKPKTKVFTSTAPSGETQTWVRWESSKSAQKSSPGSLPKVRSGLDLFGLFGRTSQIRAPSFPHIWRKFNENTVQGLV
jgi:hypothetical protein